MYTQIRQLYYLVRFELKKMTRLKRFYIALFILAGFIGMISMAIYQRRQKMGGRGDAGKLLRELLNATTFSQIILIPASFVILPVIIGIFTASSFAGEEKQGLLRTMAIRPVSRTDILFSRFLSYSIFSYLMLFLLLVISYVTGGLMFGFDGAVFSIGDPEIGQKAFYVLKPREGLITLIRMYITVGYAMVSIVALFLMFAVIMRKQGNAIVAALGFYFVSYILFPMPMMEHIRPFLPSRYMMVWRFALGRHIMWEPYLHHTAILFCFTISYLLIGMYFFRKRPL